MEHTFTVGDVEIAAEIFTEPFACDLTQCKGACCTIPGCYGAPLSTDERARIERLLPTIVELLSPQAQQVIASVGVAERGPNGQWFTATVGDRECIFTIIRDGMAQCAFHRAWLEGKSDFLKPLSCQLFPVRLDDAGRLRYERYPECRPAIKHGQCIGQTVYDTVRPALVRAFGHQWVGYADALSLSTTEAEEKCQN
ncbi:MAG: DUF3109 family protein [Chlorobi bacterium]|nr:DUF3109 family protein [Chlorobiota bacterium]